MKPHPKLLSKKREEVLQYFANNGPSYVAQIANGLTPRRDHKNVNDDVKFLLGLHFITTTKNRVERGAIKYQLTSSGLLYSYENNLINIDESLISYTKDMKAGDAATIKNLLELGTHALGKEGLRHSLKLSLHNQAAGASDEEIMSVFLATVGTDPELRKRVTAPDISALVSKALKLDLNYEGLPINKMKRLVKLTSKNNKKTNRKQS